MGWHNAEYVIGWKAVIRRILRVFEASTRMEDIEADLLASLLTWARQSWMGRGYKADMLEMFEVFGMVKLIETPCHKWVFT